MTYCRRLFCPYTYTQAQKLSNVLQQCTDTQKLSNVLQQCTDTQKLSNVLQQCTDTQKLSNVLQQCTDIQTSVSFFTKTSTGGRFIYWSTSIQHAISFHHAVCTHMEHTREKRASTE